jgi:hypothetical protein
MKSIPRKLAFLCALFLVPFVGIQRASADTPDTPDSAQITQLLNDAKSHAVEAEEDAATLESYTRSRVSWKLHTYELDSMKKHVNEMGKIASDLQNLEATGSDWQKQAIHQVMPLLRDMAGNLNKTIEHLNENQSQIHMTSYREYTRTNYELAKRTADLIRDFVDYDQALAKATALEDKLELSQK